MRAWVITKVSSRSHKVSNLHSTFKRATTMPTKNCRASKTSEVRVTEERNGEVGVVRQREGGSVDVAAALFSRIGDVEKLALDERSLGHQDAGVAKASELRNLPRLRQQQQAGPQGSSPQADSARRTAQQGRQQARARQSAVMRNDRRRIDAKTCRP